jgi:lysozyme family protein
MTDDDILASILKHEGGFVNHRHDTAGATNFGITRATLAAWVGHPVSVADVKALTKETAKEIYRANYLEPFKDVEPVEVRAHLVDIAVNSGAARAWTLLERAKLGPKPLAVQLVIERLIFYARIVKARPSQAVFIEGWIKRACTYL